MIQSNLARLLGGRRMTMAELQRRTGLAYTLLHRLYHGKVTRVELAALDKICVELGCSVGDILERVPDGTVRHEEPR
jgi:putative transcriptional regulator